MEHRSAMPCRTRGPDAIVGSDRRIRWRRTSVGRGSTACRASVSGSSSPRASPVPYAARVDPETRSAALEPHPLDAHVRGDTHVRGESGPAESGSPAQRVRTVPEGHRGGARRAETPRLAPLEVGRSALSAAVLSHRTILRLRLPRIRGEVEQRRGPPSPYGTPEFARRRSAEVRALRALVVLPVAVSRSPRPENRGARREPTERSTSNHVWGFECGRASRASETRSIVVERPRDVARRTSSSGRGTYGTPPFPTVVVSRSPARDVRGAPSAVLPRSAAGLPTSTAGVRRRAVGTARRR